VGFVSDALVLAKKKPAVVFRWLIWLRAHFRAHI